MNNKEIIQYQRGVTLASAENKYYAEVKRIKSEIPAAIDPWHERVATAVLLFVMNIVIWSLRPRWGAAKLGYTDFMRAVK